MQQPYFTPFWNNGLVLIQEGNYPKLIWGPFDGVGINVIQYHIYRNIGDGFQLLTTTGNTTYSSTDYTVVISEPGQVIYYKVIPFHPTQAHPFTNVVSTQIIPFKKQTISNSAADKKLLKIFPVPFNPSTKINYTLPATCRVTIKIYNVIGRLISTLIDDLKDEGEYSLIFNAGNLPGSVYICSMQAINNSEVLHNENKSMILIK